MKNTFIIGLILFPLLSASAETQGEVKVGKLWVYPNLTNYGYFGNLEYPGGGGDYYILQMSMAFACSSGGQDFVLFGGTVGQSELDYGIQNADGLHERWVQNGDGRNYTSLSATADFSNLSSTVPLPLEHSTIVRAYNHEDYDDFILVTHTFRNTGVGAVTGFHFGYHMPADIGASGVTTRELDDFTAYFDSLGIAYMFDDDGDDGVTPYYVGQALLQAPPAGGTSDQPTSTTQKWTTFNYYLMVNPIVGSVDLKDKITAGEIDGNAESKGPYSVISAAGPYTILPGGEISFTVGIIYGEGYDGLINNTVAAREVVSNDFAVPAVKIPPPVPEIETVEVSGRLVNITWDDAARSSPSFAGYRIYRSISSPVGEWNLLAETTDRTYLDLDVQVGFPNYYAITSYDESGNESGKWSAICRMLEPVRALNNPALDLSRIRVVPNPYMGGANWELQDYESTIYFTRLPETCSIYIYTITGELVVKLDHNQGRDLTPDNSGDESWDMLSMNRQSVVSGMYLYRVVTDSGDEQFGRFVIIRGER